MKTGRVSASATQRIAELDGVRGMAILLVLVWHYACNQIQTVPGSLAAYGMKLLSLTWAGVDLFFVLSGFLIGGILLDQRSAPHYFKAFYVRRVCRIFPLYYLLLAVFGFALLARAAAPESAEPWSTRLVSDTIPLWSYATYVQNFLMADRETFGADWMGVTWSLAVEEQFYVVLPLLVRLVPPRALPGLLGLLVMTAPVFRTISFFWQPYGGLPGYVLLPGRSDALFIGVLGAWAIRQTAVLDRLRHSLPAIRGIVLSSAVVVLGLLVTNQGIGSFGMSVGGHTALAVLSFALILLAVLSEGGRVQRLFRQRWLTWVGTVSYGIYLLHQPVAGVLHGLLRGQVPRIAGAADAVVTILALTCTLALAALSARYFEQPIVLAGQRTRYEP